MKEEAPFWHPLVLSSFQKKEKETDATSQSTVSIDISKEDAVEDSQDHEVDTLLVPDGSSETAAPEEVSPSEEVEASAQIPSFLFRRKHLQKNHKRWIRGTRVFLDFSRGKSRRKGFRDLDLWTPTACFQARPI